ncbi:MAG: CDP-alcohol phosphatidyltransferase family protein [Proteobacteria bacterium]|nr:CDP-alcohol phosphatidyltransferase family protein [Pseudomonadota bacterium]
MVVPLSFFHAGWATATLQWQKVVILYNAGSRLRTELTKSPSCIGLGASQVTIREPEMVIELRHLPNIISVLRILLVYPVVRMLLALRYDWALALFVIAGLSDALDGFLAKHYHWQSRLGSFLDPIADKLLLLSCFIVGGWQGLVPGWLVIAVIVRDALIVLGASAYYLLLRPYDGQPLLSSKLNTLCQLAYIFAVVCDQALLRLPAGLLNLLAALTLFTTVLSGALYVRVWGSQFLREMQATRSS